MSRLRKADIVGRGIIPQANTGDDDLNNRIEEAWSEFSQDPEVTGLLICERFNSRWWTRYFFTVIAGSLF